jgi:DNA-binding IclR family transcriptional regulator
MSPDGTVGPAEPPNYGIGAVERTLDVVAALMRVGPASLTHLAQEAACTRVNAFRILHTLQTRGLAIQNGKRGAWQLGVGWLAVARSANRQGAIPLSAAPIMSQLADSTGDSVYLAVRDGQECEIAAVRPGLISTLTYNRQGDRTPLASGPGKLLLAYAPEQIVRAVLASRPARTDPAALSLELERIRKRGWLITTHEIAEGAHSVSAPVLDAVGSVVAVLTIASPAIRMRPSLQTAAQSLGQVFAGEG